MFNPLKWLLTKAEPKTKESTVSDITASDSTVTDEQAVTAQTSPVAALKTGVKDFEAAFNFVEQGIAQLGEAAKDDLKALALKYL